MCTACRGRIATVRRGTPVAIAVVTVLAASIAACASTPTPSAARSTSPAAAQPPVAAPPHTTVRAPTGALDTRAGSVASDSTARAPATSGASVTGTGVTNPLTSGAVVVDDAGTIAAAIVSAERALRTGTGDDALAAAGRAEQLAFRRLARHPELQAAVVSLLPDDVAAPAAFIINARQAVVDHAKGSASAPPPATLPAWTIVAPRPVDELLADYREAERLTGVPWTYLAAINLVETRTGRIAGASSAGAVGPMQFLPATWAACCTGDIEDPHDAIIGAATFLAHHGAPADMRRAVHAYNPNDGYVGEVAAYAAAIAADQRAYTGFHGWEVLVGSSVGTVRLPVGYSTDRAVDAAEYVAAHPEDLLG